MSKMSANEVVNIYDIMCGENPDYRERLDRYWKYRKESDLEEMRIMAESYINKLLREKRYNQQFSNNNRATQLMNQQTPSNKKGYGCNFCFKGNMRLEYCSEILEYWECTNCTNTKSRRIGSNEKIGDDVVFNGNKSVQRQKEIEKLFMEDQER